MNLFKLIYSDYLKYKKYGGNFISIVFLTQGFWAIFQYRIAHFIFKKFKIIVIKDIILFFTLLWKKCIEILTGISIPYTAEIGHSLYIGHFGGIIINSDAKIGSNCNISQGVTIGVSGVNEKRGVPILKNNIYIGANAVVIGKIIVEDNVLIGANSLVSSNVTKNSTVIGVPAKKINDIGSKFYI